MKRTPQTGEGGARSHTGKSTQDAAGSLEKTRGTHPQQPSPLTQPESAREQG